MALAVWNTVMDCCTEREWAWDARGVIEEGARRAGQAGTPHHSVCEYRRRVIPQLGSDARLIPVSSHHDSCPHVLPPILDTRTRCAVIGVEAVLLVYSASKGLE